MPGRSGMAGLVARQTCGQGFRFPFDRARFREGAPRPIANNLAAIRAVLEKAGICIDR